MAQDHRDRLLAEANAAYRSLHAAEAVSLFREYLLAIPIVPMSACTWAPRC